VLHAQPIEGNIDFYIAAWREAFHGGGDPLGMQARPRPFRRASQNDNPDFSASKILLILEAAVCGEQEIYSYFFSGFQQITIGQPVPAFPVCSYDRMSNKRSCKALCRSVVKQNEHQQSRTT